MALRKQRYLCLMFPFPIPIHTWKISWIERLIHFLGPQYLKHLSKKDIFEGHLSHLRHLTELFVWFFSQLPVVTMAAFSSFCPSFPFLTLLLARPFDLGPWFTALVFFVILVRRFPLMLFTHHRTISQIKRLTRQITGHHRSTKLTEMSQEGKHKLK